jgi:hypothetical protein
VAGVQISWAPQGVQGMHVRGGSPYIIPPSSCVVPTQLASEKKIWRSCKSRTSSNPSSGAMHTGLHNCRRLCISPEACPTPPVRCPLCSGARVRYLHCAPGVSETSFGCLYTTTSIPPSRCGDPDAPEKKSGVSKGSAQQNSENFESPEAPKLRNTETPKCRERPKVLSSESQKAPKTPKPRELRPAVHRGFGRGNAGSSATV